MELCLVGRCYVADVGYHELQLAISLHRHWLNDDSPSLNGSQLGETERILGRYVRGMRQLRDSIASRLVTYDIHAMIVSIIMLWTVSAEFTLNVDDSLYLVLSYILFFFFLFQTKLKT